MSVRFLFVIFLLSGLTRLASAQSIDPETNFNARTAARERQDSKQYYADTLSKCIQQIEAKCGPIAVRRNGQLDIKIEKEKTMDTWYIHHVYANLQNGGAAKSSYECQESDRDMHHATCN